MNDLKVFQQTSDKSYDRHTYDLVLTNGKIIKFNYYDDVKKYWFENSQIPDYLSHILVKDKKVNKGFK